MMYYWNKYMGIDVYEVNLEEILDLFNTEVFTGRFKWSNNGRWN